MNAAPAGGTPTAMEQDEAQLPLGHWYAEPLTHAVAEAQLRQAQHLQHQAHRARSRCSACPFHELIARFWLGRSIDVLTAQLSHAGNPPRRRALTELVRGQLLMSRRLDGAMERLRNGFYLAGPYLQAVEYFQILKRHELLAYLPLGHRPAPAQGLAALLREAQVIQQLQGRSRPRAHGHDDTAG